MTHLVASSAVFCPMFSDLYYYTAVLRYKKKMANSFHVRDAQSIYCTAVKTDLCSHIIVQGYVFITESGGKKESKYKS